MIIPDIKIYNDYTGSDIKTGSTLNRLILPRLIL